MSVQKYRINNIFKLLLIFGIIFSTTNLVWAANDANNTQGEGSGENQGLTNNGEDSAPDEGSPQQEPEDTNANSDNRESDRDSDTEQQSKSNDAENPANQEFLTLKNILLLFAIIDLPIFALLLVLWFLDRKEQKQRFDRLTNNQNIIDRKLKQLDKITLKLDDSDKFSNQIVKEIENNKQEIIDSRIKLLAALNKRQPEPLVNSNGHANISLTKDFNSLSFNKEQTEYQLDKPSHNSVAVIEQIPQFVSKYNLDKKSLSNEAIATVAATEVSLNERRLGKSNLLTLEHTPQKKYWIIQEDDYYLVPHAKIKIDEYNKTTLESLFECINFSSDYIDFHLIEPAKVSPLDSNSELWQLEKKGKLEFS